MKRVILTFLQTLEVLYLQSWHICLFFEGGQGGSLTFLYDPDYAHCPFHNTFCFCKSDRGHLLSPIFSQNCMSYEGIVFFFLLWAGGGHANVASVFWLCVSKGLAQCVSVGSECAIVVPMWSDKNIFSHSTVYLLNGSGWAFPSNSWFWTRSGLGLAHIRSD